MLPKFDLGANRFQRLISGSSSSPFDKILYANDGFVVAPTVGSIVPNWLLIIPTSWDLNFRRAMLTTGVDPIALIDHLASHLGLNESEFFWFEHGPKERDSVVGCGLDHAHIHFIFKPTIEFPEFVKKAKRRSGKRWKLVSAQKAYDEFEPTESYLIAGHAGKAIYTTDVEDTGSQFFRKIIAEADGAYDEWNYKLRPFENNVKETIGAFESLSQAVIK